MLRSHSISISILAGTLLIAAQQPPKLDTTKRGEVLLPTPTVTPAAVVQPAPPYKPFPRRFSDACYNAADHDSADLCAQWRAALAAEKAVREATIATRVAIVGTILSLLTVLGLLVTIWQTQGALRQARFGNRLNVIFERRARREARKFGDDQERALAIAERNAHAVADQVDVARSTARSQLRAYIGTPGAVVFRPTSPHPLITIDIKNFGQTPAFDLSPFTVINLIQTDATGEPLRTVFSEPAALMGVCEPGHTQNSSLGLDRPLDPASTISMAVELTLTFVDVFEVHRWRRITYELDRTGRNVGPDMVGLNIARDGNSEGEGPPPATGLFIPPGVVGPG